MGSFNYIPTKYEGNWKWNKNTDKAELSGRFYPSILFYQFKINFFSLFDDKCFKCHKPCEWVEHNGLWMDGCVKQWELHIDHNFPFHLGGRLEEGNMVSLCKTCNSNKNKKLPEEFYDKDELERLDNYLIAQASLSPQKNEWKEKLYRKFQCLGKKQKKIFLLEKGVDKKLIDITEDNENHNLSWSSEFWG